MIELVICDWDGTLMDSQARIVHAMRSAFAASDVTPPDAEAIRQIIGLDLGVAITSLAPALVVAQVSAIGQRYRQAYFAAVDVPSPLYDGVPAALAELEAAGILLAVATGKSRTGLDRALRETGLGHHFIATRTADECAAKPHPEMVRSLLEETGIAAAAAFMVGDTTFDLEMAAAASVKGVAVTCGAHAREQLEALRPVLLLERFAELPARLRSFAC